MRILQVTNSYKPAWQTGGVCRVAYNLSCMLAKMGHEVRVLTTELGSEGNVPLNSEVTVDGSSVVYYRNWTPSTVFGKNPLPLHPLFVSTNWTDEVDVAHIHDYRSPLALMVAQRCQKLDIPYVIQMHGSFRYDIGKGRQKKFFDKMFGQKLITKAARIIALTSTEASELNRAGIPKKKISVIPNGIDLEDYSCLPDEGGFKLANGLTSKKIILYLGRLDKTKGIDLLLDSFAQCRDNMKDVVLLIIGPDDGERPYLEQLCRKLGIEERVIFLGFVDRMTKMAALADAELVVCPSYSGFPIVFLEACACGRPIVTTTNGDKLDWLDGKAGIVTEYSPSELGAGLIRLLSDDDYRQTLGHECKKLASGQLNLSNITKNMCEIYEEVIAGCNDVSLNDGD